RADAVRDLLARVQDFEVLHGVAPYLGISRRALGRRTALPDDQLLRADIQRAALQDVFQRPGPHHRRGKRSRHSVKLGEQFPALNAEPPTAIQAGLAQSGNTFGHASPPTYTGKPELISASRNLRISAAPGSAAPAIRSGIPRRRYFSAPMRWNGSNSTPTI